MAKEKAYSTAARTINLWQAKAKAHYCFLSSEK